MGEGVDRLDRDADYAIAIGVLVIVRGSSVQSDEDEIKGRDDDVPLRTCTRSDVMPLVDAETEVGRESLVRCTWTGVELSLQYRRHFAPHINWSRSGMSGTA